MTPATIAGLCALAGLGVVALTDHNAVGNCPAFLRAAEHYGLLALPGMELCTREEVHVICLFPGMEEAWAFQSQVFAAMAALPPNNEKIFGPQLLLDEEDHLLGRETRLLAGCADIGVYEAAALAKSCGGLAYPAHIDRPSFSVLSNLGLWDAGMNFPLAEVSPQCPESFFLRPDLLGLRHIQGCDAHYLHQLPSPRQFMSLAQPTPQAVLAWLAGADA